MRDREGGVGGSRDGEIIWDEGELENKDGEKKQAMERDEGRGDRERRGGGGEGEGC